MKVKSFDRKKELMEAALDEFSQKSYEDASLNNIIKNAGISKGTFYYHFQDKKALYLSLIQAIVDTKISFMETKLKDYAGSSDLNLFDHFRMQVKFGLEFGKNYPEYYLLSMMFLKEKGNPIYYEAMAMRDDTSEKYYDELLEKAMERGEFRDGVSLPFIKSVLGHLFIRFNEIFDLKAADFDLDGMLRNYEDLIDFMQYGLTREQRS
ncbi:MAG: TetR/AcrR family transcriptional regulator [Eubacteriales bacterium]|nr:TetR/AcrR family transcriptional regulator [Eubacteriales bacterium]